MAPLCPTAGPSLTPQPVRHDRAREPSSSHNSCWGLRTDLINGLGTPSGTASPPCVPAASNWHFHVPFWSPYPSRSIQFNHTEPVHPHCFDLHCPPSPQRLSPMVPTTQHGACHPALLPVPYKRAPSTLPVSCCFTRTILMVGGILRTRAIRVGRRDKR